MNKAYDKTRDNPRYEQTNSCYLPLKYTRYALIVDIFANSPFTKFSRSLARQLVKRKGAPCSEALHRCQHNHRSLEGEHEPSALVKSRRSLSMWWRALVRVQIGYCVVHASSTSTGVIYVASPLRYNIPVMVLQGLEYLGTLLNGQPWRRPAAFQRLSYCVDGLVTTARVVLTIPSAIQNDTS